MKLKYISLLCMLAMFNKIITMGVESHEMATKGLISLIKNKKDSQYTTADMACIQKHINNNADVNCLFTIPASDVGIQSPTGYTEFSPLELAVVYKQNLLASTLINAGANVERQIAENEPNLYKAISLCKDNTSLFAELLAAGTNISAFNEYGDPLLHEVLLDHVDSIDIKKEKICWLIFHNANPIQENNDGLMPYDIANDQDVFEDKATRDTLTNLLNTIDPQYHEFYQGKTKKLPPYYNFVRNRMIGKPCSAKDLNQLELLMKAPKPEMPEMNEFEDFFL